MKTLALFALATIAATASPLFPHFNEDRVSIQGSPLIGKPITGSGVYLWALEDLKLPISDYDYNDVFGVLTYYGDTAGVYSFEVLGGLGAYYNAGTAGFAGARFVNGVFTLVFNTPFGEMYSGTPQVLIYRLSDLPSGSVPEPATYALVGATLLGLGTLRRKQKRSL